MRTTQSVCELHRRQPERNTGSIRPCSLVVKRAPDESVSDCSIQSMASVLFHRCRCGTAYSALLACPSWSRPYYPNVEGIVSKTIKSQFAPEIGHLVLKINQQSRLVVSEEIAGAAPVRTAIFLDISACG